MGHNYNIDSSSLHIDKDIAWVQNIVCVGLPKVYCLILKSKFVSVNRELIE